MLVTCPFGCRSIKIRMEGSDGKDGNVNQCSKLFFLLFQCCHFAGLHFVPFAAHSSVTSKRALIFVVGFFEVRFCHVTEYGRSSRPATANIGVTVKLRSQFALLFSAFVQAFAVAPTQVAQSNAKSRSEERRVGKECRSRW